MRLDGSQGHSEQVWKSRPPPTGIRSPDSPTRSESLYRLNYCGSRHVGRCISNGDGVHWYFCVAQWLGSATKGCGKTVICDVVQKSLFNCWIRQCPRVWCFALTLMPSNKHWPNNLDFLLVCLRRFLIPGGFKLPILDCLEDYLENFYIRATKGQRGYWVTVRRPWRWQYTL